MHRLEYKALIPAAYAQDAFHAEYVLPLLAQQLGEPAIELLQLEIAIDGDANGSHFFVVFMVGLVLAVLQRRYHRPLAQQARVEFIRMMFGV